MHEVAVLAYLGLGAGATYALVALGLVLTYRGLGVVNFAQGSFATAAAYIYYWLSSDQGIPPGIAALLALLALAAVAGVTYALVMRPLRSAAPLSRIVATVGLALTIEAVIVLLFTNNPQGGVREIVPASTFDFLGQSVPIDRLILVVVAVAATAGLDRLFRATRFGLATRASSEAPIVTQTLGYSPDRLGGINWALSAVFAGMGGILVVPIIGLNPHTQTELVIFGMAVALVGRLRSFSIVCVAGLALGIIQAELVNVEGMNGVPQILSVGVDSLFVFVLTGTVLIVLGSRFPKRNEVSTVRLPRAIKPRRPYLYGVSVFVAGEAGAVLLSPTYRGALSISLDATILFLSVVVITGFLGQVSLGQAALAGCAAFATARLTSKNGIPFPYDVGCAMIVAGAMGFVIAVPALRVRGLELAVLTLAGAQAAAQAVFQYSWVVPGYTGVATVQSPKLGGFDLGIYAGGSYPSVRFGALVVGVAALATWFVAWLRTTRAGMMMLAIRSNERAAAAAGVSVARIKIGGVVLASLIAGLAGAMMAYQEVYIAASNFSVDLGLLVVAFAYLGGITSPAGAVIGGLLAADGFTAALLNKLFNFGQYITLIGGIGVLLTVVTNPDGLARNFRDGVTRLHGRLSSWRRGQGPNDAGGRIESSGARPSGGLVPGHTGPRWKRNAVARSIGETALTVEGLTVAFGAVRANVDVSLTVRAGEVVGLIGPNGAGKTTLVDAITGFVSCQSGEIHLQGKRLNGVSPHRRSQLGVRRTFQSVELFGDLNVEENLIVAATAGRIGRRGMRARRDRACSTLERLGILHLAQRSPEELSHADRRMVDVARLLMEDPYVALFDEPAAGLGATERRDLPQLLRDIAETGAGVLLIEHDVSLVLGACDRVYVLVEGNILIEGKPDEIRGDQTVIDAYLGSSHGATVSVTGVET